MKDVRPFLTTIATPTRPLGSMLKALPSAPVTSPWTPQVSELAAPTPAIDVEAIRTAAREQGLAEGLRETAELRARLSTLVASLESARAALVAPNAELIADAAACVIETWTATCDRRALLEPIVRAWVERVIEPTTARVHPDDVAALTEATAGTQLTIVADPKLARGDLAISGANFELTQVWSKRLAELRTTIASALTGASS